MSRYGWSPYVPVATRRAQALKKMAKLQKKGTNIQPVKIEGRKIARTFWGETWCDHLESFSDYANRLPRGRTYVRNGSVCHLDITKGEVNALVSGSSLYKVNITIKTLAKKKWSDVKKRCAGQIGSLLELLQGKISENMMTVVTDRQKGLFPSPKEINLECDCPDWAVMCKHVAAVLYGVGARLDEKPELLFLLRGVDHNDLISAEVGVAAATEKAKGGRKRIAADSLSDVFGIEMSEEGAAAKKKPSRHQKQPASKSRKTSKGAVKQTVKRKTKTNQKSPRIKKPTTSRKVTAKGTTRTATNTRSVTGKAIAQLRGKFGLSQSQFAKLLNVSTSSVGNWERKRGKLAFQPRTLEAWEEAKGLTKQQAERKIKVTVHGLIQR